MAFPAKWFMLAALLPALAAHGAHADPKTVCTITVNSPDEREMFRKSLPADDYRFVELVERGRPDWLASACRKGVRCDVLLISGHFDGGDEFYSDRVDARESLPVDEMERASCSDSCPGLFAKLKEVYLFGCNTLNPDALTSASGEIARSLVRAGHSPSDAEQLSRVLVERHADSNRDRMRQIFKDVPVIYGFSSKAPLGPKAATVLERYFQTASPAEIGTGRPSARLLSLFAPSSMTVTRGSNDADAQADYRRDMCRFADDRTSLAQKVAFVHELLGRDMAEVRLYLDQIEKSVASAAETDRQSLPVALALGAVASDTAARDRFLTFTRDADEPRIRARLIDLAGRLGWLTPSGKQAELVRMLQQRLSASDVGAEDVDLACTLNRDRGLEPILELLDVPPGKARDVGRAAVLACLGSPTAHAQVIAALTSVRDRDVQIAQVYLSHHPIVDIAELRAVALRIGRMSDAEAQVRALDTLALHRVSDRESLEALTGLFPVAKTVNVQRAIAGILIRSDYETIAKPELLRALREKRLKSPDGQDLIDALIRRMQASLQRAA